MALSSTDYLRQLVEQYCVQTSAVDALQGFQAFVEGNVEGPIYRQLANFETGISSGSLFAARLQPFNKLLDFFSIIEIGCLLNILPSPLPEDFLQSANAALQNSRFIEYSENTARSLPQQLRSRLNDEKMVAIEPDANAILLLSRFLDLNSTIDDDDDIEAFLQMLAGGEYGNELWASALEAMGDPTRMIDAYSNRSLSPVLNGHRKYIEFCFNLDRLLRSIDEQQPEVAAAFMQFYTPQLSPIGAALIDFAAKAVSQFIAWPRKQLAELAAETAIPEDIDGSEIQDDDLNNSAEDLLAMVARLIERANRGQYEGDLSFVPA